MIARAVPDAQSVAAEFFGGARGLAGLDPQALREAMVAEACRLCINAAQADPDGWKRVHINSLMTWVVRKLRGVFPELAGGADRTVVTILRAGPGPNLEFLGDLLALSGGFYVAAPTRVVSLDESNWALVSGRPTKFFTNMGLEVRIGGVGRWILDQDAERIRNLGLAIQSARSYAGIDEVAGSGGYLDSLIESGVREPWTKTAGMEAYLGPSPGELDFNWGVQPARVKRGGHLVSLWRDRAEFEQYDHWVLCEISNDDWAIRLPSSEVRRVCLAIDACLGRPRQVRVAPGSNSTEIWVGFRPPAGPLRLLHAARARWLGHSTGYLGWDVPPEAVSLLVELFKSLGALVVTSAPARRS